MVHGKLISLLLSLVLSTLYRYERIANTNYTDKTDDAKCKLYFDVPTSSWTFEHKGVMLVQAADTAMLPESVAAPWLTRMGQVDIDIVEVQIQNSLTEMKLSHCEALCVVLFLFLDFPRVGCSILNALAHSSLCRRCFAFARGAYNRFRVHA